MKRRKPIFLFRVRLFVRCNHYLPVDILVRDNESIKHYRIRQSEDGQFYIARRTTFRTLPELVSHYSKTSDGLCVNLRHPCVHVRLSLLIDECFSIIGSFLDY